MEKIKQFTVTIAAGEKTSTVIPFGWFETAHFYIGSDFSGNDVAYVGLEKADGMEATVKTAATASGDAVEVTTEITSHPSSWHTFPPHLAGMHSIKMVSDIIQRAAQTIIICGHGPDDQ